MSITGPATAVPTPSELGHPRRWPSLWILCGSLVLVVVSVSSLNVAIPEIQRSLGASATELQWIIDSYALVFAGLLLPAGAIGDRYGRRGALVGGLIVFGFAALGGTVADTATQLILWRGLMGAGAAFIMPATLSIVATVFGPGERPRAIAIWAGFAGAGGVIGLLASGLLLEGYWWGSVFLINVPIVVIMIAAVVIVVPTSRDEAATPLDPVGSVLSILGLVALVFAIIEGPEKGWTAVETLVAFGFAAALLTLFVLWELRTPHPMLDPRFFTIRPFSLGSGAMTITFFGIFGMFFVITQYFQFVQGHSALGAALRIMPYGIVLLVVSPRAATLSRRHGPRLVMTAGMIVATVGFSVLGLSRPDTPYLATGLALVLVALGTGLMMPPATEAIVASLPPAKAGVGSAVNDTTREVGGAVGIAVVGALVSVGYRAGLDSAADSLPAEARHVAEDGIGGLLAVAEQLPAVVAEPLVELGTEAFTDGIRLGMFTAAAVMAVGAALVATLHPRPESPSTDQPRPERDR